MKNKKLIWGGIVLLLFSLTGIRFYHVGKLDAVTNQRSARVNAVPVEVGTVKQGAIQAAVDVTGSIQGVREANVSAKATGRIEHMPFNDGEYVQQGQLIAIIDARELEAQYVQASANASSAQANMANVTRNYARMRSLAQQGAIAQQELDAVQTQYDMAIAQTAQHAGNMQLLEAQLANTKITAPFNGYIARKTLEQGEMVSSGSVLFAVLDLSKVKIEVFVSEQDIGKLQLGQIASFTVDAYPGQNFTGKVSEISPAADLENRAFKVKIEAENKGNLLKSGMFARVHIVYDQRSNVVMVDKSAIVDKNDKPVVFIVKDDQVEQREVVVGLQNGQISEIVQGLHEGEAVATFGHDTLKNGDKVSIIRKGGK